jgi:hypothetical protein
MVERRAFWESTRICFGREERYPRYMLLKIRRRVELRIYSVHPCMPCIITLDKRGVIIKWYELLSTGHEASGILECA